MAYNIYLMLKTASRAAQQKLQTQSIPMKRSNPSTTNLQNYLTQTMSQPTPRDPTNKKRDLNYIAAQVQKLQEKVDEFHTLTDHLKKLREEIDKTRKSVQFELYGVQADKDVQVSFSVVYRVACQ